MSVLRPLRELSLLSEDEYKLKNVVDILQGRLVKRGVALKALNRPRNAAHRGPGPPHPGMTMHRDPLAVVQEGQGL